MAARLTWNAPSSNGGTPITGYRVQRKRGSGAFTDLASPSASPYTDTSSQAGDQYQVAAINAAGTGPFTSPITYGTVTPPSGGGSVIWSGSLDALSVGTTFYSESGTSISLSTPWPYSSVQTAGNALGKGGRITVVNHHRRNAREQTSMQIVMDPGGSRLQPSSRGGTGPYGGGQWTPDNIGSVDHWYGFSIWYDTDWGVTGSAQLTNEISGASWHNPMAFRMNPSTVGNGSMNMSGDSTDDDGTGQVGSVISTPRRMYLRRNSVLDSQGYYTARDGLGLDKLDMGEIVTEAWMDFVIHVRWSTDTNAFREVFRDGVSMGSSTSENAVEINTTTQASDFHVLRFGIYQNTNLTHSRTAYFSNCRIGTSYAAVDPSVV